MLENIPGKRHADILIVDIIHLKIEKKSILETESAVSPYFVPWQIFKFCMWY